MMCCDKWWLLAVWIGASDSGSIFSEKDIQIEPVRKSNLIEVSYTSTDAQLAARVLRALGQAYIQRHVAVHTPPGQVEFFERETEHYQKNLADAEAELKQLSEQQDGVAPQLLRDITLQKLSEFRSSLQKARAAIADSEERIRTLEKQAGTTPERLTTFIKQSNDAQVLQGLKNTLMNLELKRTELLTKYQPTYRLVQEVDKQIADTRSSIAAEESEPIKEETTDRNPTYAWINAELAKGKADYSGLQARAAARRAIVANYEGKARDLEQKGIIEQGLLRNMKTDEESYLLYLRKRYQARMTQALDTTRIVNVAIATTSRTQHTLEFSLVDAATRYLVRIRGNSGCSRDQGVPRSFFPNTEGSGIRTQRPRSSRCAQHPGYLYEWKRNPQLERPERRLFGL